MSSFKRRIPTKQKPAPRGTRPVAGSTSLHQLSTGIPSLDDILGGGLPVGHVSLVLAPDSQSAWGELVARYFVAQGLALQQQVCVVDDNSQEFLDGCMWIPGVGQNAPTSPPSSNIASSPTSGEIDASESAVELSEVTDADSKVTIAWRYEKMKQFQTTVDFNNEGAESEQFQTTAVAVFYQREGAPADGFCQAFDLASRIPTTIVENGKVSGLLSTISPSETPPEQPPYDAVLQQLAQILTGSTRYVWHLHCRSYRT